MKETVSIIIPAYNEEKSLVACLDSVLNQSIALERCAVYVVDNGSTDQTAQIAAGKGVNVISEPKKGYVHAVRKGIEVSQGDLLAFTDADCRVPVDWVARIMGNFRTAPGVVAVGGKLAFYDVNPFIDRLTRAILYFVTALPGNNMAIRREALERIGGLDPHVNLSLDYWLTLKLRRIGSIRIDRGLLVKTSGRRFAGAFSSHLKYFANVLSLNLFWRLLFFDFPDVR